MKRSLVIVITVMAVLLRATAAIAHPRAQHHQRGRSELSQVRRATAQYHRLSRALNDGFVAFSLDENDPDTPTCFDSADGGMGVHYVKGIDAVVNPTEPEALVYEITRHGRLRLVGVEYIVPEGDVEVKNGDGEVISVNLPSLFGQDFHKHAYLPVYILHAWIWKANPDGMFADFNPRVRSCPA